jgi:indolepyruvate ferredoxin oxidoreductase beta subunit
MSNFNIMIVGVGGQGTLLASRVIGNAALASGLDIKVSEVHGMSQRGGSVVTYVRFGKKVFSPLIEKGAADIIICFEQLEALRWAEHLKPHGTIIVNEQIINPMPVILGAEKYPQDIIKTLKVALGEHNVIALDARKIAAECGDLRAVNIVLLGVMAGAGITQIATDFWRQSIIEVVPQKVLEINLKAFNFGIERGKNCEVL